MVIGRLLSLLVSREFYKVCVGLLGMVSEPWEKIILEGIE